MEAPNPTNLQPARAKKARRRCSQCGSRNHDLRTCPEHAKPRARSSSAPGAGGLPPDILRELERLGALRRALAAAGFVSK